MSKSILRNILKEIEKVGTDINKIKLIVRDEVLHSDLDTKDKINILNIVNKKKTYFSVIKSIYDLILKYEGDGVINKSLNGYRIKQ